MDLSDIKPTSRTIEIVHPNSGENVGLRIQLVSFDDERLQRTRRNITNEKLKLDSKGRAFKAEQVEENGNQMLFGAMIDWEWYDANGGNDPLTFHGETPAFNQRNVFAVFGELPWVKKQIDEACAEDKDFFTKSN